MNQHPLAKLIYNTNDIPPDKEDGSSEFWNLLTSPEYKSICLITMLQLIPDRSPSELTNEECRSILSSIYTAKVMLKQPDYFKHLQQKKMEDKQSVKEDPLYYEDEGIKSNFRED